MTPDSIPAAALVAFGRLLRARGFSVASEQNSMFLQAIGLLGPRSIEDVREAAVATLAPRPDRRADFDELFRVHFLGESALSIVSRCEDEAPAPGRDIDHDANPLERDQIEGGELASARDRYGVRHFDQDFVAAMTRLKRSLPRALPRRRSFRQRSCSTGGRIDLAKSLRSLLRSDGDIPRPRLRKTTLVQRRVLLLIDISGSMRSGTEEMLKLAHVVARHTDQTEVFTLGTRLTRITPALKVRDREAALARVAQLVEDWDGGTRLGPTLLALLDRPRFAAFARGAVVILLSDGLERGDIHDWTTAMYRLGARAHRLSLASPLVGDARFRPETAGLRAVLPVLDDLADASSAAALVDFLCTLDRTGTAAHTFRSARS